MRSYCALLSLPLRMVRFATPDQRLARLSRDASMRNAQPSRSSIDYHGSLAYSDSRTTFLVYDRPALFTIQADEANAAALSQTTLNESVILVRIGRTVRKW